MENSRNWEIQGTVTFWNFIKPNPNLYSKHLEMVEWYLEVGNTDI